MEDCEYGIKADTKWRRGLRICKACRYTEPIRIRALVAKYGPLVLTRVPMSKINVWDSYRAALEYATEGKINWDNFRFVSVNPETEAQKQAAIKAIKTELSRPLDQGRLTYYRNHGGKAQGRSVILTFTYSNFAGC